MAVQNESTGIKLDQKVKIRSIAPWYTGSSRKTTNGDISIPPMGSMLLSREEIISQAQNGNKLLTGVDGIGNHATWYIEDDYTRKELSFDSESESQHFLTQDVIKKMFDLKTQKAFENNIQNAVVTRAEKAYLIESIKVLKLNDYQKIAFCIGYTGMAMD